MGGDRLCVGPKHSSDFRAGANPCVECFVHSLHFVLLCLFVYVSRGHTGRGARFLTLALILSDLSAFRWTVRNKIDVAKTGTDHFDRLLSCRGAVNFLRSQTGLFRVQVIADDAPNIGDVFQIQTTWGGGATVTMHYWDFVSTFPAPWIY